MIVLGWIEMKNPGWKRERMENEGCRGWGMKDSIWMDRDEESRMKERNDEGWRMKDEGDGGWMIVLGRIEMRNLGWRRERMKEMVDEW